MNILSIGGSDPSSGAGIQGDIRAASALDVNCFSVITAITSQNTAKFSDAESVSPKMIKRQLDSIFSDFEVDAISVGMVYDSKTILAIHSELRWKKIPIILDPVIESTTGGTLLKKTALGQFRKLLIPLCHVITPNVSEAQVLSGLKIAKESDLARAAKKLAAMGAEKVVITGHRFVKDRVSDFVYEGGVGVSVPGKKIGWQAHGGGCTFSFALCYAVASKKTLVDSVKFAKNFTYQSMESAQVVGHGVRITSPKKDQLRADLSSAIREFGGLGESYGLIPECQTNFVYSRKNPKSTSDILGVSGRIVKAGKRTVVAGSLEYGGSRHVATAVLTMQKKFPKIRSALNIRYDQNIIERFQRTKSKVARYDRADEPEGTKIRENSSISWGVMSAIKNSKSAPDIVYHTGDIGKEPMIIVFGENPKQVVRKISKIL